MLNLCVSQPAMTYTKLYVYIISEAANCLGGFLFYVVTLLNGLP